MQGLLELLLLAEEVVLFVFELHLLFDVLLQLVVDVGDLENVLLFPLVVRLEHLERELEHGDLGIVSRCVLLPGLHGLEFLLGRRGESLVDEVPVGRAHDGLLRWGLPKRVLLGNVAEGRGNALDDLLQLRGAVLLGS